MSTTRNLRTPPAGALPDNLRPLIAEFERLRESWLAASTRLTTLSSKDAISAAERADVKLALDAARDGDDPGAVGTPNADALTADLAAAERAEAAYRRSMDDYWTGTVAPALRAAADAQIGHWRAERDARVADVREALTALRRAESRWLRAAEAVAYYQRIAGGDSPDFGGLSVPSRGTREPDTGLAVISSGLEQALHSVAAAQDASHDQAEPEPQAEPQPKPQPRRAPARRLTRNKG